MAEMSWRNSGKKQQNHGAVHIKEAKKKEKKNLIENSHNSAESPWGQRVKWVPIH